MMDNFRISRNSFFLGSLVIGVTVTIFVRLIYQGRQFFRIQSKKCKQLIHCKGLKIFMINSSDDWVKIPPAFFRSVEKSKIVGLDCEWLPKNTKKPVALLQISSQSGECVLIRLCKVKEILPKIQKILENEEILKVGVGILGDIHRVRQASGVFVRGCFDLRHLVSSHQNKERLKNRMGLAGLSAELLDIALEKDLQISCSNWEASCLTNRQIEYASLDAFVSEPIFCELINDLYQQSIKTRFFPVTASESWAISREIVKPYLDKHFKASTYREIEEKSITIHKKISYKVSRLKEDRYWFQSRKGPLYSNCYMEAPDGEILCTCDSKKAAWYLSKGIAEQVKKDPLTIRLKFEPSGRPVGECDKYYQTPKDNCCVVCGKSESYVRKNIVPQEYRKHFPDIMKNHQSHDVVLLCIKCHKISNSYDLGLRTRLAEECNAPIGTEGNVKVIEDFSLRKVISSARAIKFARDKIPLDRLAELEAIIIEHFDVTLLTDDILEKALRIKTGSVNEAYQPHGLKVVNCYAQKCGLVILERLWRKHFIDSMKPKFLPPLWSLDHNKERLNNRKAQNRVDPKDYVIAVAEAHTVSKLIGL